MKQYDIFISYRRSSYDTANLIATRLRSAGYSVFFDMETLRSGKFNEQLYEVIDNCKDFVLVLPPNALDRCVSEDDWVRLELSRAMAREKNIIPIMLNGFAWPEPMPVGLEELCNYQALTASSVEYFDLAMERLQRQYLVSRRMLPMVKVVKYIVISLLTLLAVLAIAFGVLAILSKGVCQKYATALAKDASYVHIIAEENARLAEDWALFDEAIRHEHRAERICDMQCDMERRIDFVEKSITQMWRVDDAAMDIGTYHSFLLSIYNINSEEIAISPQFATLYYTDYLHQLETLRNAVRDPHAMNLRYATALFAIFEHSINSYYASLLSELSNFPKSSRSTYEELVGHWVHFPIQLYKIDESREYYERIINTESALAEDIISRFESALEVGDAAIEDIERKNRELEQQIEDGFANLQSQVDAAAEVLSAAVDIAAVERQNEAELALRREKVEAKRASVEASKAELAELDKKYVEAYEKLKRQCTIEQSDDQWYKWGKVVHWSAYLNMVADSRMELEAQGIYSTSAITPEVAYADMNSMLSVYQIYHPESEAYVSAAKEFYREVSRGQRPYAGVIIFGFKDDAEHPFFRQGDIVVEYDGQQITKYEDFSAAYKANKEGEVRYLRLSDEGFEECYAPIANTDIVGFLELTE